jgi:hypothetical protein
VSKSYYKMHPNKNNSEEKFPSDRDDEERNKCYFNKETFSPHEHMTCLRANPLCIPQERTGTDPSASMQDSVTDDQEDFVARSPRSSFPREQEKDRGIKSSLASDLRPQDQFQFRFRTHQTENHNLESRIEGRSTRNPTECMNVRDIDTSQTRLKKVKELDSGDKSLSDLYSLVRLQNEQLRYLQAQVDTLLLTRDTGSSAATPVRAGAQSVNKHVPMIDESTQTEVADSHCDAAVSTDPSPLVSVGVMTSFNDTADLQRPQPMKRTDRRDTKPRSGNRYVDVRG